MNCPDWNELALYLEGALDAPAAERVQLHLAGCERCRQLLGDPDVDFVLSSEALFGPETASEWKELIDRLGPFGPLSWSGAGDAAGAGAPDLFPRLAADDSPALEDLNIPSQYADGGELVMKFQVEADGQSVRAHLISADPARRRFRPVRVGESVRLSDAAGEIDLSDLTAGDVLGMSVSVPPLRGRGSFYLAPDRAPVGPVEFHDTDGRLVAAGRLAPVEGGEGFWIFLTDPGLAEDSAGLVVTDGTMAVHAAIPGVLTTGLRLPPVSSRRLEVFRY